VRGKALIIRDTVGPKNLHGGVVLVGGREIVVEDNGLVLHHALLEL
jgi:hypothetical protein